MTSVLIPLAGNFLVPNGTFIAELIAFAIIVFILAKWVIPPINKAMTRRQEEIRKQFADLDSAKADADSARQEFESQIAVARQEAAKIRDEAREQGAAIIADMREQAQAEHDRIVASAHTQLEAERRQIVAQMRDELGSMAISLAGMVVGETLNNDDERARRTVDRFLTDLETNEQVPQGVTAS